MPRGEARKRLDSRITELAAIHRTPVFPAHVTIVGSLADDVADLTRCLAPVAAAARRCRIVIEECGGRDSFFTSLYHCIELEPGLDRLRDDVTAALDITLTPWSPHLSLLYGDLTHAEREFLIARTEAPLGGDFEVDAFHIWSTTGPVAQWHHVATLPFGE